MRKMLFLMLFLLLISLIGLTGCWWESDKNYANSGGNGGEEQDYFYYGYAQKGYLAGATVEIYELDSDGSKTLKWTEITSSGDSLSQIGRFNVHADEVRMDKFYLYKVSGGIDWDVDDNGIKDNTGTPNKGTIRALVKGADVKNIGKNQFRVTLISELVYERVAKLLNGNNLNFSKIRLSLEAATQSLLKEGIDGDDVVVEDMIRFNPVEDFDKIKSNWKKKMSQAAEEIYQGSQYVLANMDPVVSNFTLEVGYKFSYPDIAVFTDESAIFIPRLSPESPEIEVLSIDSNFSIETTDYKISLPLPSYYEIRALKLSSDNARLYVLAANSSSSPKCVGVYVYDVSDLSKVSQITNLTLEASSGIRVYDMTLSPDEKRLYLGGRIDDNGNIYYLLVVKINKINDIVSNLQLERKIGKSDLEELNDWVEALAISPDGERLYLWMDNFLGGKLAVMTITPPSSDNPTYQINHVYDVGFLVRKMFAAANNKLYIGFQNGVKIFDMSDLDNIKSIGNSPFSRIHTDIRALTLNTNEDKLYGIYNGLGKVNGVSKEIMGITVLDKTLISENPFFTYEVFVESGMEGFGGMLPDFAFYGDDFFVLESDKLKLINKEREVISSLNFPDGYKAGRYMKLKDDKIYVYAGSGFLEIAINNDNGNVSLQLNQEFGSIDVLWLANRRLYSFNSEKFLYLDMDSNSDRAFLKVVNLSDYSEITDASLIALNNDFDNIFFLSDVFNNKIFVSGKKDDQYICRLVSLDDFSVEGSILGLGMRLYDNNIISVATIDNNFKKHFELVDFSNPASPRIVGDCLLPDNITTFFPDVVFSEDKKFAFLIAWGDDSLHVLDLCDLSAIKYITSIKVGLMEPTGVKVKNNILYVFSDLLGESIMKIDISNLDLLR